MHTIWVADAFTNTPLKGGPAGVCVFDEFPPDEWMQKVSYELGFSNSAFLKKLGNNHYQIRWFTPTSEAPICGHATIASMHILVSEGFVQSNSIITLESMRGKLYVSNNDGWYNLDFPTYPIQPLEFTAEIESCVNAQPLFCGFANNIIMLELENEMQVRELKPNLEAIKNLECRAISVTAAGTTYDFVSRYFAPKVGINEDPVCASAHCFLIPYWAEKLNKPELKAYQASRRGAELKCKFLGNRVLISGEAVTVFKGNITNHNLSELKYVA